MELFGEFAFGDVIAKDAVGLVWMGTCRCLLRGGLGYSGIFHRPLVRSSKPVMITWLCFQNFDAKLGEDGDAVIIAKFSHGDERACGEVIEDMGGLRFWRKFV